MKPFDLGKAKAGDPIVTRDGRRARFVAHVPDCDMGHRVLVKAEARGFCSSYAENGKFDTDNDFGHPNDLFMAPKKREGWVNIYPCKTADGVAAGTSSAMVSKEVADGIAGQDRIACVRIEWEE